MKELIVNCLVRWELACGVYGLMTVLFGGRFSWGIGTGLWLIWEVVWWLCDLLEDYEEG